MRCSRFLTAIGCAAFILGAQEQSKVEFDVASLKLAPPKGGDLQLFWINGGRFFAKNATLKQLVEFAFNVRGEQVSGGPRWVDSDEYEIEAKPQRTTQIPEGFAAADVFRMMVASLLESRFQLGTHRESRDAQIYELRVAKGGPKLTAAKATIPSGLYPGRGRVEGKAASMALLAIYLSGPTGRVVVDKTGLGGSYDFVLTWTPELGAGPGGAAAADAQADVTGPSIFTALQEQLGVRLEPARGPVESVVIDRAEKPGLN